MALQIYTFQMMKKILLIAFSLIASTAFAQYNTQPPPPPQAIVESNIPDTWGSKYFYFGLNFTPGIYWVNPTSSNNSAHGAAFGYGYGANLEFYFTHNYAIVLGMEVSSLGAKYINKTSTTSPLYDSTITHDESLQYLQFPILLKMKTPYFGRIQYYGLVGAEIGFLLKATDDYFANVQPIGFPLTYSADNSDIYRETNFFRASLDIGLGAQYRILGSSAVQASLTYNTCFTNLNSKSSSSANIKGIELMLGVLF